MRRILFSFFFLPFVLSFTEVTAGEQQDISIRLFASYNISSFNFFHVSGTYSVYGDSSLLFDADHIALMTVSLSGDSVLVQTPNYERKFRSLRFFPKVPNSSFKLKSVRPDYKARTYDDELLVSALPKTLRLVNKVNI